MAPANARSQLKDHVRHVFGGIAVPAEIAFPEKAREEHAVEKSCAGG